MALKAVHVSDVPNLDQVTENASLSLHATRFSTGVEIGRSSSFKVPKFLVIGHRGYGMNKLQSTDPRMKAVKENSIVSFNTAASFPVDFIEFDVQVTKDGCPIIFHDNFIVSEEQGTVFEKRVTELNLCEFLAYGPPQEDDTDNTTTQKKAEKPLLRKTKDGKIVRWDVETDDVLCTLQEAFERVEPRLGFNIELKFDDYIVYQPDHLTSVLLNILKVVFDHAKDRPIIFSSFQPDAALVMRKLQGTYPVFFLTNGGTEIYYDVRRNSLEEAVNLCLEGGLDGIVSEVKGVFRNPGAVTKIKDAKLSLLTYGQLNNVGEAVYMQHVMGIDGVIVDLVKDITEAVSKYNLINPAAANNNIIMEDEGDSSSDQEQVQPLERPQFTDRELSFLLKLIPELIQQ